MNWKTDELGNHVKIAGGGTPDKSVTDYWNGDIPWASVKDLKSDYLTSTAEKITSLGVSRSATRIIPKGQLIIATRMAVGKIVVTDIDVAINQDLKALSCNSNLHPKFLFYLLKSKSQYFESVSSGATVKGIKLEHIKKLQIPLPPLPIQQKIAVILDAADAYRQKTKALIEKYDQLTQSLFLEMFGDPVRNEKGWECTSVHKVCSKILGGGTPSKTNPEYFLGSIPWVTPKDMKTLMISDSIDHITKEAIGNSSTKLIPKNSVLMVIRSGILKRKLPVAINSIDCAINQDMKAYVPKQNVTNSIYMLYYFQTVSPFLLGKVRAVTADNIEFKQIRDLEYPLPPILLQNEFAERVIKIRVQIDKIEKTLSKSEELFQSLLQRAFKGELIV